MSLIWVFLYQHCTHGLLCYRQVYLQFSLRVGLIMMGRPVKRVFISWKVVSHRSSHLSTSFLFINLRMIFSHSTRRGMNVDNVVSLPTNLYTSLRFRGDLMSRIVVHLSRFAFTPLEVSINQRNFPSTTPNTHLAGFNLMSYLLIWPKISLRSSM